MANEIAKVVVTLEGGLVGSVISTSPVEVLIVDYDSEGADDNEITKVPKGNNEFDEAIMHCEEAEINKERTEFFFDLAQQEKPVPEPLKTVPFGEEKWVMLAEGKNCSLKATVLGSEDYAFNVQYIIQSNEKKEDTPAFTFAVQTFYEIVTRAGAPEVKAPVELIFADSIGISNYIKNKFKEINNGAVYAKYSGEYFPMNPPF